MKATAWAGTSAGCSRKVAQEPDGAELDGAVGVVEVEVAGQLLGAGSPA